MPDSVLLWTRVTPTTGSLPGSEVGPGITEGWEMAEDSGFLRIVATRPPPRARIATTPSS